MNSNHGLTPKKIKYPPSYPESYQVPYKNQEAKQLSNFQFSSSPYTNPIFEYLQHEPQQNKKQNNFITKSSFVEQNNDEIPEGYAIKRKVTHQQTLIIPSIPYPQVAEQFYNHMYNQPQINNHFGTTGGLLGQYGLVPVNQVGQNNLPSHIEYSGEPTIISRKNKTEEALNQSNQNFLVNNIKNIIANSQAVPNVQSIPGIRLQVSQYPNMPEIFSGSQNPYAMSYGPDPYAFRNNYYNNPYYAIPHNYPPVQPIPTQKPMLTDTYYANLQTEKENSGRHIEPISRQMGGPFSQYFPIVIKNPFQQMFQAFTSMVEYGPATNLCRSHHADHPVNVDEATYRSHSIKRGAKTSNLQDVEATVPILEIKNKNERTEVSIQKIEESNNKTGDNNEFYIEGLKIIDSRPMNNKSVNPNLEQREMTEDDVDVVVEEDKFFQKPVRYPSREEIPQTPSNGIFIQKLKVRKGGVAIAGPGGIATAGSGGTAIVGPNGFAYTQPNGVAIAGPGSRVISVDPEVNLSEFVQNVTRTGIMSRLGKLVAIGPVVYHDLGEN